MSAKRKQSAVLRLLRGEDLELVSRELAVPAAEVSGWRDAFLAAGEAALKTRPVDGRDAEIGRLKRGSSHQRRWRYSVARDVPQTRITRCTP